MKLTNNHNLHPALFNAIKNDPYTKGDADISVTGLIAPMRFTRLKEMFDEQLSEDAMDKVYSLQGQAMHVVIERANVGAIAERRLMIEVDGVKISGGMDSYSLKDAELIDWKNVTLHKFKSGKIPEDYVQQLNCYAEILRQNEIPIKKLTIIALYRDWSKMAARRDSSYPQSMVECHEIPLWPTEKTQAFLKGRVQAYKDAKKALPECSDEERWAKPGIFAVMKTGRKSAVKLHDTKESAETHAGTDKALSVVYRPGENIRCEYYCVASSVCEQFQRLKASYGALDE